MSLKAKAVNGVLWSSIERFSVQGMQFVLTIIIARFVSPSDYGIVAMISVFLAIAQVFIDSGFSNALIQKKKRTEKDFSTVFYFNIVVAVLVYVFLFFASPYIAAFYDESRLNLLTKIIGLSLIISSFSIVQKTKLTIDLDFRKQAFASFIAVVVSGLVGIYMAYVGYGVWAIVCQSLLNNLCIVIMLFLLVRWHPKLEFSFLSFKSLCGFGFKILLSNLSHTIYVNLYNLIIGKKFSSSDLGYFNRAQTIAYFPSSNLSNIFSRVFYPTICSIQEDDLKFHDTVLRFVGLVSYIIFPLMIGLNVLAYPLIETVLTDKWLDAVPLLQLLSIAYMWEFMMTFNYNILSAKGQAGFILKSEIIKKILAVVLLVVLMNYGIKIICVGLICYSFIDICITSFFLKKACNIGLGSLLKTILPNLILSCGMGIVVYCIVLFCNLSAGISLVIGIFIGIIFYVMASYLVKNRAFYSLLSIIQSYKYNK